jgi:nitrate reductase NapAB chaperone NapD
MQIELDFLQTRARVPALSWILLLAGVVLFIFAAERYQTLAQTEQTLKLRAAELQQTSAKHSALKKNEAADPTKSLLQADWNMLLKRLEETRTQTVALLSLEANAKTGQIIIQAESANEEDMIDYLERLKLEPLLQNAVLANHEVQEESGGNAVRYTIRLKWALQ